MKSLFDVRAFSFLGLGLLTLQLMPSPEMALAEVSSAQVNAIVASVDGTPITLRDIAKRLSPARPIQLKDAAQDPQIKSVLEGLILEHLILNEAESKRVSAGPEEINQYIEEVARRNSLTREGFEKALVAEGRSLEDYKRFVKVDILRSRLAASILQTSIPVSDAEIDSFLAEHQNKNGDAAMLQLARIVLKAEENDDTLKKVRAELEDGADFTELAKEYSLGPEAQDGGVLGEIAEKDLQSEIFDAVFSLKEGETSKTITNQEQHQIFKLLKRTTAKKTDSINPEEREQVRALLSRQKQEARMQAYFNSELIKTHTVDRKL
jgi:parvulin-like peptidyl-prolyl isomerase